MFSFFKSAGFKRPIAFEWQIEYITPNGRLNAIESTDQFTVEGLALLTTDVIQQSDIRLEEFARHFCTAWGLSIKGESKKASESRLFEIDFGRLMKEAEAARDSADDRMAYLRKIQDEQESRRRPRRGKW